MFSTSIFDLEICISLCDSVYFSERVKSALLDLSMFVMLQLPSVSHLQSSWHYTDTIICVL